MSEGLWGDVGDPSDFALPGDEELMESVGVGGAATATEEEAAPADAQVTEFPPDESEGFEQPADEPQLILGKYKDHQALEHAHQELQGAYGRMSNEVSELRRLQEQMLQAQQYQQQQAAATPIDDLIASDPQQAMAMAWQHFGQNSDEYKRAKEAWDDLSPGAPSIFEGQVNLAAQIHQIRQELQATAAPVQEQQATKAVADAYQRVAQELPDIEELRPAMRQIIQDLSKQGQDWITPAMESGDPGRAHQALRTLALSARGLQGQNLAEQARQVAREHVAETERAKQQAVVASASTTLTQPPPSAAERLASGWADIDAPFKQGPDGWNI